MSWWVYGAVLLAILGACVAIGAVLERLSQTHANKER